MQALKRGEAGCAAHSGLMPDAREPRPTDASHPSAWATLPRTCGAHRAGNRHNIAIGGSSTNAGLACYALRFQIQIASVDAHTRRGRCAKLRKAPALQARGRLRRPFRADAGCAGTQASGCFASFSLGCSAAHLRCSPRRQSAQCGHRRLLHERRPGRAKESCNILFSRPCWVRHPGGGHRGGHLAAFGSVHPRLILRAHRGSGIVDRETDHLELR